MISITRVPSTHLSDITTPRKETQARAKITTKTISTSEQRSSQSSSILTPWRRISAQKDSSAKSNAIKSKSSSDASKSNSQLNLRDTRRDPSPIDTIAPKNSSGIISVRNSTRTYILSKPKSIDHYRSADRLNNNNNTKLVNRNEVHSINSRSGSRERVTSRSTGILASLTGRR